MMDGRHGRWIVGIDFGEANVKLVCLEPAPSGLVLTAHGFFRRANTALLKHALSADEIRRGRIRVNIEDPSLKIRRVEIPRVPAAELPEVIKWALKDVVTGHVDEYSFRHHPLPVGRDERKEVHLVYAVERRALERYLVFLRKLGLPRPEVVEPNAAALFLSAAHDLTTLDQQDTLIFVDMGSAYSLFAIMNRERLLFSRPLADISGNALTRQISRDLGVGEDEAEKMKVMTDTVASDSAQHTRLKNTIGHFLARAATEMELSLTASAAQFPNLVPRKVVLSGGGALLEGFRECLRAALKLDVEVFDPFCKIDVGTQTVPLLAARRHYYGLAMGLAL